MREVELLKKQIAQIGSENRSLKHTFMPSRNVVKISTVRHHATTQ
jgi:hypothetical protein